MLESIKHFYKTHSDRTLFVLACFVLFWPLAVYLMWRHNKWNIKARSIVTAVFIGLTVLIGVATYNAPPTIALSNNSIASNYKTDHESMVISGDVSTLHSTELLINGKQVPLSESGVFNYKLSLQEGDTDIQMVAKSEKGVDTKRFTVHRTTAAEFAERERIAKEKAAESKRVAEEQAKKAKADAIKAMPICNGKSVTSSCKLQGVIYKTYVYHPAVAEKTHTESVTTYKEETTGYCTLCADGTYSPTCATGRGACSWHGGVAQWNAPIISKVPVYTEKTVVDAPAQKAYYEKVLDKQFN